MRHCVSIKIFYTLFLKRQIKYIFENRDFSNRQERMTDVEEVADEIRDLFCKYKEKQKVDIIRTLNNVRTCECGHSSRVKNAQCKLAWYRNMTKFYQIIMIFIIMLAIFGTYALWAARRYNRARLYGNGACVSTFFWTYDECSVSF